MALLIDTNILSEAQKGERADPGCPRLRAARSYRRIAGYFTSSLFEIAHEWFETVEEVRDSEGLAPVTLIESPLHREDVAVQPLQQRRVSGAHCTPVRFPNRATNGVGYVVGYRHFGLR